MCFNFSGEDNAMGIFVNYSLYCECSEEELVGRLKRFRERVSELDVEYLGEIVQVDPVYNSMIHSLLERDGYKLPPAVQERIVPDADDPMRTTRVMMSCDFGFDFPEELEAKFWQPALDFLEHNDLWDENDYPEELAQSPSGYGLTVTREGISLEFAQVLLRYGYSLLINPAPGCESIVVSLSTLRSPQTPVWSGWGFTKTQYAERFVPTHELVCRVVDLMQEVGLLHHASDTCGFYEHRDWSRSAERVNLETTVATAVSKLLMSGVQAAREAGAEIEVLSAPALERTNLVVVKDAKKPRQEEPPA